jgi:hypothetical protein
MKHRLNKRQPKSEMIKQHAKLHAKYKEYSLKTIQELEEMLPILGGGYKEVCLSVMREKFVADLKAKQSEELPEGEA